jgi:HD-GYP domain-containing protein (c-di-GMP phosphodiesterase class II)
MTTDRPYRNALTNKEAIKELKNNSGTQFDSKIAETMIEIIMEEQGRAV